MQPASDSYSRTVVFMIQDKKLSKQIIVQQWLEKMADDKGLSIHAVQ